MNKPFSLILWVLAFLSFAVSASLAQHEKTAENETRFLAPPPEYIEYFSFGFRESLADSLWLRWIQDSDACQTYRASQTAKPIDQTKDAFLENPRHKICDDSWGFKMLDATTRLAPKFEMVYLAGGSTLAVAVEDYEGATLLFNRGIEQYPKDWTLLYRAAYHFLYDTRDLKRAAFLLNEASNNGAPTWLKSLASRIYTRSGQLQLGISTLENYKATLTKPSAIAEVDQRIAELKAKMAKEP